MILNLVNLKPTVQSNRWTVEKFDACYCEQNEAIQKTFLLLGCRGAKAPRNDSFNNISTTPLKG